MSDATDGDRHLAPVPAIPLGYSTPETDQPRWPRAVVWLLWLSWSAAAVAWVLVLVDVELVLGSGPVLFALGLVLAVFSSQGRWRAGIWVGVGHCGICLVFVALVNLLTWSPADARTPFTVMGAVYVVCSLAATIVVTPAALRRAVGGVGGG